MPHKAIFIVVLILISFELGTAQSGVQARITQPVDEQKLVRLSGNTHPLAQAQFDRGAAPDDLAMNRMLLVLQRGADQEAALQKLLEDQQSKSSPQYHKWLTPQEFGERFGPADADLAAVTNWLRSQGFRVGNVAAGRNVVEFSGSAGQIRQAFGTEIHKFVVNGEEHWANASDPQIPAALAPVVRGIVSLHNFRKQPMHRNIGLAPQTTLSTTIGTAYGLGPTDFAIIYNVLPLWSGSPATDGTGQTIAVVGRSNINIQDIRDFRTAFGLPANDPVITLDGPDPGLVPGDESEAALDVEWSGGVAKGATINLVVSESTEVADGVDLSAFYIVDNNLAGVLSESFGQCEASLTDAGNIFYQLIWEQSAAQGITVLLSSGDNGSAGCDSAFVTAGFATNGLAVSGLASTSFNVAVGGTDFDDAGIQAQYFNSTNASVTQASAKSYIPEKTWNDSCAAGGVNGCPVVTPSSVLSGGSGGPSNCASHVGGVCAGRAKPSWQTGVGVPQDGVRDLPDLSFFGGGNDSLSFYLVCEADLDPGNTSCNLTPQPGQSFGGLGGFVGTSASVQVFAGVMAMVNQKMGGRQGNANYVLYPLAATNPANCNSSSSPDTTNCIFYDVTKGNISMPCAGGTPNCSDRTSGTGVLADSNNNPAWLATTGYDRATGLGTVNVANLVTKWNTVSFRGTATTLSLGQTNSIPHGTAVSVNITVAPGSGSGTPTGPVSLIGNPPANPSSIDGFVLNSSGNTSGASTTFLPGGSYTVFARYAGDGTFGASDSTPPIAITVGKENSSTFLHLVTPDRSGNPVYTVNTATYGSELYLLRADVTNVPDGFQPGPACSTGCPTGSVTIKDNGQPLDGGTFQLNSAGFAEDQLIQLTGGVHALTATYSGDNSFNTSTATNLSVTIAQANTTATVGASQTTGVTTITPLTLSAGIATSSGSQIGPGGTVTFFSNGTQIGSPVTVLSFPATTSGFARATATMPYTFTTTGTENVTATYSGDTNYAPSPVSSPLAITVTQGIDFDLNGPGTPVIVTAGGSSTATITVVPDVPFTAQIPVTCPAGVLPPGVTCSPSPLTISVNGIAPVTGQLTVSVAAPSAPGTTAELRPARNREYASLQGPPTDGNGWWRLSAGTGLMAIVLFLLPGPRRHRTTLALWLVCLLSFAIGCGGGGSSGVTGGGGGTVAAATSSRITAPQTKVPRNSPLSFNVAVTLAASGTAAGNGTVQLFDGTTAVGSPVEAVNGAAVFNNITSLSVGTHQISAHYLGDSSTLASQSGAVNVTVTGNTTISIQALVGSGEFNGGFVLTIN